MLTEFVILISNLALIFSTCAFSPENREDCWPNHTNQNACCIRERYRNGSLLSVKCIEVNPIEALEKNVKYLKNDNVVDVIECGDYSNKFKKEGSHYNCGPNTPLEPKDCHESSTKTGYNCCFYKSETKSVCFDSGTKTRYEYKTPSNSYVFCKSDFLTISLYSNLILFVIIFFN